MQYSVFIASVCLSAFSMPLIMGYAQKNQLYDTAGGRKIHSGNIPRLGRLLPLGIGGALLFRYARSLKFLER